MLHRKRTTVNNICQIHDNPILFSKIRVREVVKRYNNKTDKQTNRNYKTFQQYSKYFKKTLLDKKANEQVHDSIVPYWIGEYVRVSEVDTNKNK